MNTHKKEIIYDAIHYFIIVGGMCGLFVLSFFGKDSTGLASVVGGIVAVGGINFFRVRNKRNTKALGVNTLVRNKSVDKLADLDDGKKDTGIV